MDHNYNLVKNFTAVGTTLGDVHEFEITADNTAIITVYKRRVMELTAYGHPGEHEAIYDGEFQEIDLDTGKLLFSWSAADHISLDEHDHGRKPGPSPLDQKPWDVFHMNSVEKDARGNYLVSVRHMSTIYYIEGVTGKILWRLGGKNNDFEDLVLWYSSNFYGQHHARWHDSMTKITLFDNSVRSNKQGSRAMILAVDTEKMTVKLLTEVYHPRNYFSGTRGSVQVQDNGMLMVGYGSAPAFSEYSADGKELLCDWQFGALHAGPNGAFSDKGVASYRAFRMPWKGYPLRNPDVVFDAKSNQAYVSWNGATEVKKWVLEGMDANAGVGAWGHEWESIATFAKVGFETNFSLPVTKYSGFRLMALDSNDATLGAWRYSPSGVGEKIKLAPFPPRHRANPWTPLIALALLATLIALLVRFSKTRSSVRLGGTQWTKRWRSSSSQKSSSVATYDDRASHMVLLEGDAGRERFGGASSSSWRGGGGMLEVVEEEGAESSSMELPRVGLVRTLSGSGRS